MLEKQAQKSFSEACLEKGDCIIECLRNAGLKILVEHQR